MILKEEAMKRIMVVALYRGISEYYCEYLQNIFGDLLQIESYYMKIIRRISILMEI